MNLDELKILLKEHPDEVLNEIISVGLKRLQEPDLFLTKENTDRIDELLKNKNLKFWDKK